MSDAPPSPSRPTAAFPQCLSCRILMRSLSALVRREAFSDPLVLPLWKMRPDSLLPLSAGSAPGASNTVAFKRDGAPRSRPASTRPKHNHAAAAVLIFEEWSLANYLYPFPDAATKAQMSADTGAVSLMCVCAPHAYRMQHSVACASEKTQARCQPQPPALPMLTRARSACARVCERERAKALFISCYGTPLRREKSLLERFCC